MSPSLTEQLVKDVAAFYFGTISVTFKLGAIRDYPLPELLGGRPLKESEEAVGRSD